MKAKAKRLLKKTWWWIKWIFIWGFLSSLLYIIICIWLMPPITVTQITNSFGYGLKRDYVSWDEISYNVKLAAIASEDQAFPDHGGFDWDAIEKSLRPKKKKKENENSFRRWCKYAYTTGGQECFFMAGRRHHTLYP